MFDKGDLCAWVLLGAFVISMIWVFILKTTLEVGMGNFRKDAIEAGVAEYVIVEPTSSKAEFRWIPPAD